MTYETVVPELLARFPHLRPECGAYMDEDEPLAYVAFGAVLIPRLEEALLLRDVAVARALCDFFEGVATESINDARLADLLGIEIGEWLRSAQNLDILTPLLGPETKRICGYLDTTVQ